MSKGDKGKKERASLHDLQAVLTKLAAKETQGNTLPMLRSENRVAKLRSPAHALVVGPQGSGKTSLLHAFKEECRENPSRREAAVLVDCQRENFATDTPRRAVVRTAAAILECIAKEMEPRRGIIFGRKAGEIAARAQKCRAELLELLKRSDVRDEVITEDLDESIDERESEGENSGTESVIKANKNETKAHLGAEGKWTGTVKAGLEYSRTQTDHGHRAKWSHFHKQKATEKSRAYRRVVQYSEKNDIMHALERMDDQIKQLIREAKAELGADLLHLCFDNFNRVPMLAQPWVADYLRRIDQDVSIKIAGETSQIDAYASGDKGHFGLQEGANLHRVDLTPQLEMDEGVQFFRELIGEIDALHAGHPFSASIDDDALRAMMIYSGCRPGAFIRLLAAVVEESIERSRGKGADPRIDRSTIQAAALRSYGLRKRANLALTDDVRQLVEGDLAGLAHRFVEKGVSLFSVEKARLATRPEERLRLELLVDLGIIHLVSKSFERQGKHFEVYYVDLAALESVEGVDHELVGEAIPKLLGVAEMMSPGDQFTEDGSDREGAESAGAPRLPPKSGGADDA